MLNRELLEVLVRSPLADLQEFPSNLPLQLSCILQGAYPPATLARPADAFEPHCQQSSCPKVVLCTWCVTIIGIPFKDAWKVAVFQRTRESHGQSKICFSRKSRIKPQIDAHPLQLTVYLTGNIPSRPVYRWAIASTTGLNNITSISSSAANAVLDISAGMLAPESEYTFTCQVQKLLCSGQW